ncbi:hypothetical protein BH10PSE12_BH10PSE12_17100 [soil metagenome]
MSEWQLHLGATLTGVQTIADEIKRWFVGCAPDGFALFREQVIPILQRRGLFRTDYTHDTLRGDLGLSVPGNRYAAAPITIAAE